MCITDADAVFIVEVFDAAFEIMSEAGQLVRCHSE
jgi:hypothetical protein